MGKTALGASSGIGYELAGCFAAGGANLVLAPRDNPASIRSPANCNLRSKSPRKIARLGYHGFLKGNVIVIPGGMNKLAV